MLFRRFSATITHANQIYGGTKMSTELKAKVANAEFGKTVMPLG